jgi:hypothetical protein
VAEAEEVEEAEEAEEAWVVSISTSHNQENRDA